MTHRDTVAAALAFATFATLSLVTRPACADGLLWHPPERACNNIASMKANDLITQGNKPSGRLWHGVGCYSDSDALPARCDWKTSITVDHMLSGSRRLLVARSRQTVSNFSEEMVVAFRCESGHLKPVLRTNYSGGLKVEAATADELIFVSRDLSDTRPFFSYRERRDVYRWNSVEDRYTFESGTLKPLSPGIATQAAGHPPRDPGHVAQARCNDLSTLPAADLMTFASAALQYGDFAHGVGCDAHDYGNGHVVCDWKTQINEDRMLSKERRMIVAESLHMTGTGLWGAVMVFACEAGHIRTVFADEAEGLGVADATPATLALDAPAWQQQDAHADPSLEKHLIYKWNPARVGYDFVRGTIIPRVP